jgi:hypothetical protein
MNIIRKIWNSLDGKRTYIIAVVVAVLNLAVAAGWISPANLEQINIVLGALGVAALRSGIQKAQ